MSKSATRAKREDSFNLSMVDLFGCGFIAAIFLFILNVLQPQLEAAGDAGTASKGAGRAGDGFNGPVFVSIKSEMPVHFLNAGPGFIAPDEARGFSADDQRFKYTYDQIFPNASALKWPLAASFCMTSDPADKACRQNDAGVSRSDVVVRLSLGYSTMTAFFVGHALGERLDLAFDPRRSLTLKIKQEFVHQLEIDLRPKRREPVSYRSLGWFFSAKPFVAAAGWLGGVAEISTTTKDQARELGKAPSNVARCWVFADSAMPGGAPSVICPENAETLVSAVGDEPWRSDVFAQAVEACRFPFDLVKPCKPPAAEPQPGGIAKSYPDLFFLFFEFIRSRK